MKQKKWYMIALNVILFVLLLPICILCIPFMLFRSHKKKKYKVKLQQNTLKQTPRKNAEKQFSMQYVEPADPLPEAEFVKRIDEFVCLQYWTCDDHSGSVTMQELIAAENPKIKEKILMFLVQHPISELLQGERNANGCDLRRWKIRFIFEDSRLNRCVTGYGTTELTAPYLQDMLSCVPGISSQEEQKEEQLRREQQEHELRNMTQKMKDQE